MVLLMLSRHPDLLFRKASDAMYSICDLFSRHLDLLFRKAPGAFNALPSSGYTLQASLVHLMLSHHPDLLFRKASESAAMYSIRDLLSRHPDLLFRKAWCI